MSAEENLLEVRDLVVEYPARGRSRAHRAVDGVSLSLRAGETLGLVGESGSGKSTIGRSIIGLVAPESGEILLNGTPVSEATVGDVAMVFQDPYSSFDPRWTIRRSFEEAGRLRRSLSKEEREREYLQLLERVGMQPRSLDQFPHQFSGGQRQRLAIARALISRPKLIIADEPVSALDVSVQAQVLELFWEIQRELGTAMLFISHDLSVVRLLCQHVSVLYRGEIVEEDETDVLFGSPRHEYTRRLLSAVPSPVPRLNPLALDK